MDARLRYRRSFLQRFGVNLKDAKLLKNENKVLANVRQAANQTGRTFALMYDLSGMKSDNLIRVQEDWATCNRAHN